MLKGGNLKKLVQEKLIRVDGKLNSPALKSEKNKKIVAEATKHVENLIGNVADFSQVWWHLKNNEEVIPKCRHCSADVRWNERQKQYNIFCTQQCAVASTEAKERTSKQFKGKKHSESRRKKQSERMKGHTHSSATIRKLSEQKQGRNNPQFGKTPWNFGLVGEANPNFGKKFPDRGLKGKDNPQYGKSPSPRAGRGIWGKFNKLHFRSSLELFYLMFWYENNKTIHSAECSMYRVEYNINNMTKTYSPDFYIEDDKLLVEVKPERLQTSLVNVSKMKALKEKHHDKECCFVGFKEIGNYIKECIERNKIEHYIKTELLTINEMQYNRLVKNYGDIIRSVI